MKTSMMPVCHDACSLLLGNLDMKGIMRSVKKSDLEKVSIRNCEQLMKECKYQTKMVSSFIMHAANYSIHLDVCQNVKS